MNPTKTPQNPGGANSPEPGPQTSPEAKPEQKTKESSQAEKERLSNLAGDQDVAGADDTRSLP